MILSNIRILLVEDEELDARALKRFLAKSDNLSNNYEIDISKELSDAIKKIQSNIYDIILLDLNLPDSMGLATLERVSAYSQMPIVILTGANDEQISIDALKGGAQDYLVKGEFDSQHLTRSIRYALERDIVTRRIKLVLETTHEAYLAIDHQGCIAELNPAAQILFGWDKTEILGQRVLDALIPESLKCEYELRVRGYIDSLSTSAFKNRQECLVLHKDGHEFPVEMTVSSLMVRGNIMYSIFVHDISDRKRLEQMKEEFISAASHELRTPIAIIQGAIANLNDSILDVLNDQEKNIMRIAGNNIRRLAHIINNLLDISRLESGRMKAKMKKLNLADLLPELVDEMKELDSSKKLQFVTKFPNEAMDVIADEDMIIQVLNNLISNAVRYAESIIKIEVNKRNEGGVRFIQVSVGNDGAGLESSEIAQLFQKFVQINRPQGGSGYKGTGLGLAICKEIISQHHGRIWAESEKNVFTYFNFTVPEHSGNLS